METTTDEKGWSAYKRAQVRYRRRGDEPDRSSDLPELVDFSCGHDERILPIALSSEQKKDQGLYRGKIYGLTDFPGFLYAPQALSESLQLEVAYRAVSEYCEAPNATNIDLCPPKDSEEHNINESIWELWKSENAVGGKMNTRKYNQTKKYRSFRKLSWATAGYHYDWTARSYHEGAKSPMPILLGDLATLFARTALLVEKSKSTTFTPSASIVNYYNTKSNMGGHRDDLEMALDKPIVSISMGLPAIFLLGGKTKDDSPVVPILIRPGDVLCMGGDCRLNYHGMARLLPAFVHVPDACEDQILSPYLHISLESLARSSNGGENPKSEAIPENDRRALEGFLSTHRININVRQVYDDAN
jgi:alkylated DNA repair protein alkB family protein 1